MFPSDMSKTPVFAPVSFVEKCAACAPVSDEPRASRIRMFGNRSSSSCLRLAVKIAPPDVTMMDIYKSIGPFLAIKFVVLGLCMAFPDLITWLPNLLFD